MSHRKFTDRSGSRWEVKVRSKDEWVLEPLPGNLEDPRTVTAPSYQGDPFELSERELQTLLHGDGKADSAFRPSPFGKDDVPPSRPSPFRDDFPGASEPGETLFGD